MDNVKGMINEINELVSDLNGSEQSLLQRAFALSFLKTTNPLDDYYARVADVKSKKDIVAEAWYAVKRKSGTDWSKEIEKQREAKKDLEDAQKQMIETAKKAAMRFPEISKADIKPGHIYRTTLLRRIDVKQNGVNGEFTIESLALEPLESPGEANFSHPNRPHAAWAYITGMTKDPVKEGNRQDVVVIEIPVDTIPNHIRRRIRDDHIGDLPYWFLPSEGLSEIPGVRIYRPVE